ncbi:WD40/YVTN/BNR-like repeat-containing protein [Pseudomonas putida]|uniref:WD40/YVTN/BNR-like repeat-containing protein n=1 Tax=Pseudomonas putida TaxID=303 RepID=UPI0023657CD6|nr:YCF48-related protein [Pseudomonas putida]MDD2047527.1 YCF48-related protein [Pseudomonas putida]
MKVHSLLVSLFIGVAGIQPACVVARDSFQDVLDSPAVRTELSSRQLITGLAQAGTRIVGVGRRGHIVFSDDGGRTWQQSRVPVSCDLNAVHFPSPQVGWAVGHDGVVLRSTDGGASWERKLDARMARDLLPAEGENGSAALADLSFLGLWFETERQGFIVGAFNQIWRTTDGGTTWEKWSDRAENPMGLHLYAVRAIGEDTYVAGEAGLLMKLDRQAGQFKRLDSNFAGTFFGITGMPGHLIAYGLRGSIVVSSDAGSHWRAVETEVATSLIADGMTATGDVMLLSQDGQVLASRSKGTGFTKVAGLAPVSVAASLVPLDDGQTLVVGSGQGLSRQVLR